MKVDEKLPDGHSAQPNFGRLTPVSVEGEHLNVLSPRQPLKQREYLDRDVRLVPLRIS